MIQKVILLLIIVVFTNCKQEPNELFYGKWKGAKWVVNGEVMQGLDPSIIKFEFIKKDNSYTAQFGISNEEGTFNLRNNCFNAMSIYGSPKKCPILRLEKDTMVWMMDSVQQPGNLYLVRVKE